MLSEDEADPEHRATSETLRQIWLNETRTARTSTRPYTFADGFCGAGGVSCGAQMAGLDVRFAFDKCRTKISTYRANYPRCRANPMDITSFITHARLRSYRVDVLHLSPPCQPYSAANTRPNEERNEVNQAPLLACKQVIQELRPRIVTMEETPGLIERHPLWFNALIEQFTSQNFSVRWKILKCSDYGVPQSRRRLIIIAAAPGEVLPPFPRPTHFAGQATVGDALKLVTVRHTKQRYPPHLHDPHANRFASPLQAYHSNSLAQTITCSVSGREMYHPSGLRPFTVMELAALQTFPVDYQFGKQPDGRPLNKGEMMTQIGNAVPPKLACALMKQVVKTLAESDATADKKALFTTALADRNTTRRVPQAGEEVIELD